MPFYFSVRDQDWTEAEAEAKVKATAPVAAAVVEVTRAIIAIPLLPTLTTINNNRGISLLFKSRLTTVTKATTTVTMATNKMFSSRTINSKWSISMKTISATSYGLTLCATSLTVITRLNSYVIIGTP